MPLTDTMLRNLKPDGISSKLADSEGLYLYVSPTGCKRWRMDYRFAGKRKTLSLKDARNKRDTADIDPGAHKKTVKAEAEAIAKEQALTFVWGNRGFQDRLYYNSWKNLEVCVNGKSGDFLGKL